MSHTPGPWAVGEFLQDVVIDSEGLVIAEQVSADDIRLIAAAPELLQALIEVFVIGDTLVDDVYGYEFVQKARAAINKATGEQA